MTTLSEKYRVHNRSKSDKLLFIYILIFAVFIISTSFARYISQGSTTLGLELADWCIKINDTEITPTTTFLENKIDLVVTDNISEDGLIMAGQKGYFDIVIDPQYTEVSLQYSIIIDTSSLPSQIVLTEYSVNDFSIKETFPNDYVLEGQILLNGNTNLEDTDQKTYRIYWEWPIENAKMDDIQSDYKVKANVEVEQII